jgi:uncharacterized tellurite resistance protein B-like protein
MGFLTNLYSRISGLDVPQRAAVDAVCLSVVSDGEMSDEEHETSVAYIAEMLDISDEDAAKTVDHVFERIEEEGADAVLASIAERLSDHESRRLVFLAAAFIQHLVGHLDDGEDDLLDQLAAAFDLSDEDVEELLGLAEENAAAARDEDDDFDDFDEESDD